MADEQMSEQDVELLESVMCMALGNFENFNGAPYIAKLAYRLKAKNIPFNYGQVYIFGDALTFPWSDGDVVCHHGSYGHKQGHYEFMGDDFLTPEESARDSVKGHVTLEDAVSRIVKAYNKFQKKAKADAKRK